MYKESITWKSLRPFMLFPSTCWLQTSLSRKQLSLSRWEFQRFFMFTLDSIWLIFETTNWLSSWRHTVAPHKAIVPSIIFLFPFRFSGTTKNQTPCVYVCMCFFFSGTKTHQTPMMKDDHQLEIDRRKIDEEETQTSGWKINVWCNKNTLFPQRMVQWKMGFLYTRTILIHFSTPQWLWEGYPPGN